MSALSGIKYFFCSGGENVNTELANDKYNMITELLNLIVLRHTSKSIFCPCKAKKWATFSLSPLPTRYHVADAPIAKKNKTVYYISFSITVRLLTPRSLRNLSNAIIPSSAWTMRLCPNAAHMSLWAGVLCGKMKWRAKVRNYKYGCGYVYWDRINVIKRTSLPCSFDSYVHHQILCSESCWNIR